MVSRFLCCLVFFGLLSTAGSALSAEPIRAVMFAGMPWVSLTENQQDGIVPKFWQKVIETSGLNIELQVQPYKRMIRSLESGAADVAIFFRSPLSEKIAEPVVEITYLPTVVISNHKGKHHSYDDLKKLKIAVKRGVAYQPDFDHDPSIEKVQTNGYGEAIGMMVRKRVDAVVGSQVSLAYHMASQKQDPMKYSYPYILKNNHVYLQIAKKSNLRVSDRQKLIEAVEKLVVEDTYQKLIDDAVYFAFSNH